MSTDQKLIYVYDDFNFEQPLIMGRLYVNVISVRFLLNLANLICSPNVFNIFSVAGIILYAACFIKAHPLLNPYVFYYRHKVL